MTTIQTSFDTGPSTIAVFFQNLNEGFHARQMSHV